MLLKNSATLLEDTRTNTLDGPPYIKKGTRQYYISQIISIPCAPNWVSKTLSIICSSNTMVVYINTFKHKWNLWTLPHWAWIIDTLSRSSINLSRRGESLDLQTLHSRSRAKASLTDTTRDRSEMDSLRPTSPNHNTIREMRR
jgi:hypothetical protein